MLVRRQAWWLKIVCQPQNSTCKHRFESFPNKNNFIRPPFSFTTWNTECATDFCQKWNEIRNLPKNVKCLAINKKDTEHKQERFNVMQWFSDFLIQRNPSLLFYFYLSIQFFLLFTFQKICFLEFIPEKEKQGHTPVSLLFTIFRLLCKWKFSTTIKKFLFSFREFYEQKKLAHIFPYVCVFMMFGHLQKASRFVSKQFSNHEKKILFMNLNYHYKFTLSKWNWWFTIFFASPSREDFRQFTWWHGIFYFSSKQNFNDFFLSVLLQFAVRENFM